MMMTLEKDVLVMEILEIEKYNPWIHGWSTYFTNNDEVDNRRKTLVINFYFNFN